MSRHQKAGTAFSLLLALIGAGRSLADESLTGRACRSVHLFYPGPAGAAFYCEVKVEQSAPGSYFMVCGWDTGYFGIQEIEPDKKIVLFSVWDAAQGDNPSDVAEETRVRILHTDEHVKVSRFGGEGTGGKSTFEFNWKPGETYRCLVFAKPDGKRTQYAGYFYLPEGKKWKHLVTYSTITEDKLLSGYYSFIEDFRRNGISAGQPRRAQFGNVWVQDVAGQWSPQRRARFTGDTNPAENIDAGTTDGMFYLATGGDTRNIGTKLQSFVELPEQELAERPQDLPAPPGASDE